MKTLIIAILIPLSLFAYEVPVIPAKFETTPIPVGINSADDVAIWANSSKALILGVSKNKEKEGGKGGIGLYNLDGSQIAFFDRFDGEPIGPINNIDLRQGIIFSGKNIDILAGSNRSLDKNKNFKGISLFQINGQNENLQLLGTFPIMDSQKNILEPYGLCMYHSKKENRFFVFSVLKNGEIFEHEVSEENSKINLIKKRTFNFQKIINRNEDVKLVDYVIKDVLAEYRIGELSSEDLLSEIEEEMGQRFQLEGCVADDDNGILYVGMEKLGVFKVNLKLDQFLPKLIISVTRSKNEERPDQFAPNIPRITDDVEGIGIFNNYLIVSIQGISEYAIFNRNTDSYLGSIKLTMGENDPITQTDGLEVLPQDLGEYFPKGILVVHDHENTNENGEIQNGNYKIIDLESILNSFNL